MRVVISILYLCSHHKYARETFEVILSQPYQILIETVMRKEEKSHRTKQLKLLLPSSE